MTKLNVAKLYLEDTLLFLISSGEYLVIINKNFCNKVTYDSEAGTLGFYSRGKLLHVLPERLIASALYSELEGLPPYWEVIAGDVIHKIQLCKLVAVDCGGSLTNNIIDYKRTPRTNTQGIN